MLWISDNLANLLICAILAFALGAIIFNMIKNKKRGKSSCGCGCGSCPMSDACHQKK